MWIANAAHSRNIDRRTAEEFGIPSKVLMERAGLAVFDAVREMLPDGGKITLCCGKGDNGGDGLVVARHAHERGYDVECLIAADRADELSVCAQEQLKAATAAGLTPFFASDARWARRLETLGTRELIVDALLGTGTRSEVHGHVRECIQAINRSGVPVVAVDLPSGVCCDTGEELGESVWALRTITFGLPKPYLFEGIGLEHSGFWTVDPIGIPQSLLNEPTEARLVDAAWVASLLPERLKASHKGQNGSVLIVAGCRKMRGAAVLSAMGAIRSGAGLVTVAGVEEVLESVSVAVPEALLLPLPSVDGVIAPEAAGVVLDYRGKAHSAVFGPGLTHEPPVQEFLSELWRHWDRPSVVDADALNAVSQGVTLPRGECVLTPHPGEMSRLMQTSIAEILSDRFLAVDRATAKTGKVVLLKGAHSIVGAPDEPMMVNWTGNPGMASGGMGDVLSGIIGTLMAQDLPAQFAAAVGMYWHGTAADLCAAQDGMVGYTASDVARHLPQARARITAAC